MVHAGKGKPMKTIITETKVYKFKELSETGKQKALDNLRDINVDSEYWYDYEGKTGFSQDETNALHANGLPKDYVIPTELIDHDNIYFYLGRGSYIQLVNPSFSDDEVARCFCGVSKRIWSMLEHRFYVTSGRNGDTKIEFTYCGRREFKAVNEAIEQAEERINDKIQEVLSDLRKNYDYATGDEAIIETIEANDYEFTEDGEIFRTR